MDFFFSFFFSYNAELWGGEEQAVLQQRVVKCIFIIHNLRQNNHHDRGAVAETHQLIL